MNTTAGFDPRWESIHAQRQWGTIPNEHLVRYVRYIKVTTGKQALDLGCGAGAQTRHLATEGFGVTGIDGSASAIERCKARAELDDGFDNARFIVGDVCDLPFDAGEFDLVTEVCCLQHILKPNDALAMKEVARVLKPHGRFFSLTARWDHSPSWDTPLRTMRNDEVRKLFTEAGFRIVSLDRSSFSDRNGAYWVSHWIVAALKLA